MLTTVISQWWLNQIDSGICNSHNTVFVVLFHSKITDFLIEMNCRSNYRPRSSSLILKHSRIWISNRSLIPSFIWFADSFIRFHCLIPEYLVLFLAHFGYILSDSKFSLKLLQFFIVVLFIWVFKLQLTRRNTITRRPAFEVQNPVHLKDQLLTQKQKITILKSTFFSLNSVDWFSSSTADCTFNLHLHVIGK